MNYQSPHMETQIQVQTPFHHIVESRSWFYIQEFIVPCALCTASAEDVILLVQISQASRLDEAYAIAFDRIGQPEKAEACRNWIRKTAERNLPSYLTDND